MKPITRKDSKRLRPFFESHSLKLYVLFNNIIFYLIAWLWKNEEVLFEGEKIFCAKDWAQFGSWFSFPHSRFVNLFYLFISMFIFLLFLEFSNVYISIFLDMKDNSILHLKKHLHVFDNKGSSFIWFRLLDGQGLLSNLLSYYLNT